MQTLSGEALSEYWDKSLAYQKEQWNDSMDRDVPACTEKSCEIIDDLLKSPIPRFKEPERKIKLCTNRHPHGGVDLLPVLRVHKHFLNIGILGKYLHIQWQ